MFVYVRGHAFLFLPANAYSKDDDDVFSEERLRRLSSIKNCYSNDEDNVFSVTLNAKNDCFEMCLIYPQFGWPEVDKTIHDWAVSFFEEDRDDWTTYFYQEKSGCLKDESEFFLKWNSYSMGVLAPLPERFLLVFILTAIPVEAVAGKSRNSYLWIQKVNFLVMMICSPRRKDYMNF